MLTMLADVSLTQLLERMDPDFVGVIVLLTMIMSFVLAIVVVVTAARTFQNIASARMHRQLIQEMLDRGLAIDEIEQLLNGRQKSLLARFFDGRRPTGVQRRPAPPVKPTRQGQFG